MARSFDFCSFWHCLLLPATCLVAGHWLLPAPTAQIKLKERSTTPSKRSMPVPCRHVAGAMCVIFGQLVWRSKSTLPLPTPYKTSAAMMPEVRCVEVSFIWALWRYSLGELWEAPAGLGLALCCSCCLLEVAECWHGTWTRSDVAQDRVVVFLTCITGLGQIAAEGHRKEQAGAVKRRVCTFTSHVRLVSYALNRHC